MPHTAPTPAEYERWCMFDIEWQEGPYTVCRSKFTGARRALMTTAREPVPTMREITVERAEAARARGAAYRAEQAATTP